MIDLTLETISTKETRNIACHYNNKPIQLWRNRGCYKRIKNRFSTKTQTCVPCLQITRRSFAVHKFIMERTTNTKARLGFDMAPPPLEKGVIFDWLREAQGIIDESHETTLDILNQILHGEDYTSKFDIRGLKNMQSPVY